MADPCAQLGLVPLVATEQPHTEQEEQLADSKAEGVDAAAAVTGVECK